jgi:hypothetical protein
MYSTTAILEPLDDDLWSQVGPYAETALRRPSDDGRPPMPARTFLVAVIAAYQRDATWVEIANNLGCHPETLAKRMRLLRRSAFWDVIVAILAMRFPDVWWAEPQREKRHSREWAFKGLEDVL